MDSSDAVMKSASNLNEKFGEEDLSSLSDAATGKYTNTIYSSYQCLYKAK